MLPPWQAEDDQTVPVLCSIARITATISAPPAPSNSSSQQERGPGLVYSSLMAAPLEFWFDLASTYSYVAALSIEQACAQANVPLVWRPFLLGPIFAQQLGISDSPFNVNPVRGRYMWRDLERLCAKHGLPWRRPGVFPRNSVLAARVACAGAAERWGPGFVRAAFRA